MTLEVSEMRRVNKKTRLHERLPVIRTTLPALYLSKRPRLRQTVYERQNRASANTFNPHRNQELAVAKPMRRSLLQLF